MELCHLIFKMTYVVEVTIWRMSLVNEINLNSFHEILCYNGFQWRPLLLWLLQLTSLTVLTELSNVSCCYSTVILGNLKQVI